MLPSCTLLRGIVGLYDFTPNGQPIIDGPIGLAGYYVAAGFSGIGFKSAPATGALDCSKEELTYYCRAYPVS